MPRPVTVPVPGDGAGADDGAGDGTDAGNVADLGNGEAGDSEAGSRTER